MKHDYDNLSDEDLIRLYQDGNSRAFDTFYRRYEARVRTRIRTLVKKDKGEVADIEQEIWFVISRYLKEKFKFQSLVGTYVWTIISSRTFNYFRDQKRNKRKMMDVLNDTDMKAFNQIVYGTDERELTQASSIWQSLNQYMQESDTQIEMSELYGLYDLCEQSVLNDYSEDDTALYEYVKCPHIGLKELSEQRGESVIKLKRRITKLEQEIDESIEEMLREQANYY